MSRHPRYTINMQIDDKLIARLEDISHLALSSAERTRLTKDLGKIMRGMTQLAELNIDGILATDTPECGSPFKTANVFRENAPHRNNEMIVVPKTIE